MEFFLYYIPEDSLNFAFNSYWKIINKLKIFNKIRRRRIFSNNLLRFKKNFFCIIYCVFTFITWDFWITTFIKSQVFDDNNALRKINIFPKIINQVFLKLSIRSFKVIHRFSKIIYRHFKQKLCKINDKYYNNPLT